MRLVTTVSGLSGLLCLSSGDITESDGHVVKFPYGEKNGNGSDFLLELASGARTPRRRGRQDDRSLARTLAS